jgi:hypothetical protein
MYRLKNYYFLLILIILLGIFLYWKSTPSQPSFSVEEIQFNFPDQGDWEISLSNEKHNQINQILQQNFYYLGKGARLICFLSEDGQYVLKFFKYRYHQPHWAVRFLPAVFPFESYRQKKMKKVSLHTVLTGYKIAYDHDPEGTGLLYIHLNLTNDKHSLVTVIDKQGNKHLISLDRTRFILQRKVKELTDLLHECLSQQNEELALKRINQIFDLYHFHYQQGLYDVGIGILRNNGFIGEQPIHFDVGKMTLDFQTLDPNFQRKKLVFFSKKVEQWLDKHYPCSRDKLIKGLKQHVFEIDNASENKTQDRRGLSS